MTEPNSNERIARRLGRQQDAARFAAQAFRERYRAYLRWRVYMALWGERNSWDGRPTTNNTLIGTYLTHQRLKRYVEGRPDLFPILYFGKDLDTHVSRLRSVRGQPADRNQVPSTR